MSTATRPARLLWVRADTGDPSRVEAYDERGLFAVCRHGTGRKYWETHYPDGTYEHSALTKAAAQAKAEAWQPERQGALTGDSSAESGPADSKPAPGQGALTVALRPLEGSMREQHEAALHNLARLADARQEVERMIAASVEAARTGGDRFAWGAYRYGEEPVTWQLIGLALGVTKQSAQAKYRHLN